MQVVPGVIFGLFQYLFYVYTPWITRMLCSEGVYVPAQGHRNVIWTVLFEWIEVSFGLHTWIRVSFALLQCLREVYISRMLGVVALLVELDENNRCSWYSDLRLPICLYAGIQNMEHRTTAWTIVFRNCSGRTTIAYMREIFWILIYK